MKDDKLSILREFYKYPPSKAVTFGSNVATNTDPAKFPNLVVAPKDIQIMADDLKVKQAAMITGGTPEKAARDTSFDTLTDALDKNANIVEVVVDGNLEMLLNTGYLPASNNRSSSPLDPVSILSVANNGTTSLLVRLTPVTNARSYQVQVSPDAGKTWVEASISTQARRVVLNNLVPGTVYFLRARGIGGSTGASDWSGSTSIMCT